MTEPTIVTVLRMDHEQGMHSAPNQPNSACPSCPESALSPGDDEDDGSEYFRALDRHDVPATEVPPPVSTLINMQRARRRIE